MRLLLRFKQNISLKCDIITELDLITDFDLITKFQEVSIIHFQLVLLANRGLFLLQTSGLVPFGTCIFLMFVQYVINLSCFRILNLEHLSVLLFCF